MPSSANDETRRRRLLLTVLGLASLLTALDFTIVYVALPHIAREVGFSAHTVQWVVSAYAIAFGGLLLLGGRLSDVLGHRRLFLTGMVTFTAGSLLGGLVSTPGLLISMRVLQGLGAAALFPATLALVNTSFSEGAARNRALTVWATAGASGLSLGALLGGVLTETVGWRGVFLVNVPLAVLGAFGAVRLLHPDGPSEHGRSLDVSGALTSVAGASLLVFALAQALELGWTSPVVLATALGAVALIAMFLRVEATTHNPLVPLHLFTNRNLAAALAVIALFGMSLQAIPYLLTIHFQTVLGLSALQSGLAFLAPTAAITSGNLLGERFIARFGLRAVLTIGLGLGAAGALLLVPAMTAESSYLAALPGLAAAGLGMGLVFPAMFNAASTDVAPGESGIASGMASTALQIGTGAGLAIIVGVVTANLHRQAGDALRAATADGLQAGLYVVAAGAVLAFPAARTLVPHRQPTADRSTSSPQR